MASSARLLDDQSAIEVVYTGSVTADVLAAVSGEALALAREHDVWRVLTDCRAMASEPSVFSLYDLAALLAQLGVASRYREAVLLPDATDLRPGFDFYENAMVNRGLEVRCYLQRRDAMAWLHDA